VKLKLDVEDAVKGEEFFCTFDPQEFCGGQAPVLNRPKFLAIISSATLALTLAKKSTGHVDGFIVEGKTAGGHNAPPRGAMQLTEKGEPVYGERDVADLEKIKAIGLPFWLAGSYGQPGKLAEALQLGAAGVQVGTAFAFCDESGVSPELKHRVIEQGIDGKLEVYTDPVASPTGFPFKVVQLSGTASEPSVYAARERLCDLGYLRHPYRKPDGTLGYRCPAEAQENYLRNGGKAEDTTGRKCMCNGLMATIGLGQVMPDGGSQKPLVTAGDDIGKIVQFLKSGRHTYSASDVIDCLLA
jgi:nitronate monooxygenase